ncbi:MAG: hypothetical protein ABW199_07100, partial [Caulobacterales bacterium]
LGEAEVYLGGRGAVPLVSKDGVVIGVPHAQRASMTAHIVYQGPIRAPIEEGAEIAKLVVETPGVAAREYPLVAGRRIGGANWFAAFWTGLTRTLGGGS